MSPDHSREPDLVLPLLPTVRQMPIPRHRLAECRWRFIRPGFTRICRELDSTFDMTATETHYRTTDLLGGCWFAIYATSDHVSCQHYYSSVATDQVGSLIRADPAESRRRPGGFGSRNDPGRLPWMKQRHVAGSGLGALSLGLSI